MHGTYFSAGSGVRLDAFFFNRARPGGHSTPMMTKILSFGMLLMALASCGEITVGPQSKSVGAACTADAQCARTCLVDDQHFPGGMCTLPCATNADCPSGSVCAAEHSGLCVVSCAVDADCAAFGRGFVCDHEQLQSGTGEASICRVP
jgi:hypothetical protein